MTEDGVSVPLPFVGLRSRFIRHPSTICIRSARGRLSFVLRCPPPARYGTGESRIVSRFRQARDTTGIGTERQVQATGDADARSPTRWRLPAEAHSGAVSATFCEKGRFRSAKDLVIDMESLHIVGGRRLNGTVHISGMKNAALPILFACALNSETCVLHNVPPVRDVETTISILTQMGVEVRYLTPTTLEVNGAGFRPCTSPDRLVESIRASSYLMGVELALCGNAHQSHRRVQVGYPPVGLPHPCF